MARDNRPLGIRSVLPLRDQSSDSIVQVADLTRVYGTGDKAVHALEGVSLDIRKGEFLSVLGPSGCGKSTLLNILAGFDHPTEGTAAFEGEIIDAPSHRRGVVFQDTNALFPWMTIAKNVEFGLGSLSMNRDERRERAMATLDLVGLRAFADKYPRELSGGMRQLAAIARIVVMKAELLLMDEPFAALDAITRHRMQIQLADIWTQTKNTVMFITHSVDEAIYLGDRVVVMSARPGKIRLTLTVDLPRPRDLASFAFNKLRAEALKQLGEA